jgi:pyruvate/2-oxoglutarate dehydrogenase complex dihydrolipoamide dehydrogenase (E3) component
VGKSPPPANDILPSRVLRVRGAATGCMFRRMRERKVSKDGRFDFDTIVIGGGSGGYAAARTLAAAKQKVAVVDGAKTLGGLCILRGCMPSKALLYAAEVRHLAQHGGTWGLRPGKIGFDFRAVMRRKDEMIRGFAEYRQEQLAGGRFTLVRAQARFVDRHTVELSDGRRLRARHFVIATGSVVAPNPIPGLDAAGYLTSDSALELKRAPKSLIVLGGGAIGVEMAQFFQRFDTQVTLIQRNEHLLREFDHDAADAVTAALRADGMRVFTGTHLMCAERLGPKRKRVVFSHNGTEQRIEAEEILFALGRSPNTAGLALGNAGVTLDRGRIITNERMQTSARNIFAAGDCTSPHEIVHLAIQQGEIAARNILQPRRRRRIDYRLSISVVFSDPQVATVGLTEREAKARGVKYLAASHPFNDHGKSMIIDAMHGFVKLLADPRTGEIIGGACVGPGGGDLIHEIVTAMAKRMTVAELAATPHYHPTLAEIWTYPAEELAEQVCS